MARFAGTFRAHAMYNKGRFFNEKVTCAVGAANSMPRYSTITTSFRKTRRKLGKLLAFEVQPFPLSPPLSPLPPGLSRPVFMSLSFSLFPDGPFGYRSIRAICETI